MAASQAIAFLVTIGAKKANVYERAGRKARLTFQLRGKMHGVDVDDDDIDSGAKAIPKIRELISGLESQNSLAAKMIQADAKYATGGARLKYVREEANLKRPQLSEATGVPITVIKDLEEKRLEFDAILDAGQLIAIATVCKADANWLAGREILPKSPEKTAPPPAAPVPFNMVDFLATPISLPEDRVAIGARIREARIARGMSQVQVGTALGVAGVTVLNAEKGRATGLFDQLSKIADVLGVTEYKLRTGFDEPPVWSVPPVAEPEPEPVVVEPEPVAEAGPIATTPPPVFREPDYVAIGERIREARILKDWNQTQLGEQLGVSINVILNAEKGRTNVVHHMLDEVAEQLDCSEEWLDSGTGRPPPGYREPSSGPPPPGLVKVGETRAGSGQQPVVHYTRPAEPRRPAVPAPRQADTRRAGVGDPLNDLWKHLDRRLDQMQEMARLRHEEVMLNIQQATRQLEEISDTQKQIKRYVRATYRLVSTAEPTKEKSVKKRKKTLGGEKPQKWAWTANRPPEDATVDAELGAEEAPPVAAEPELVEETVTAEPDNPIAVMTGELLDAEETPGSS